MEININSLDFKWEFCPEVAVLFYCNCVSCLHHNFSHMHVRKLHISFFLIHSDDAGCFFFIPLLTRAQTIMKARLKGAQTGRNLLKKKSDALTLRFRQILKKIIEVGKLEFSFVWLTWNLSVLSVVHSCSADFIT